MLKISTLPTQGATWLQLEGSLTGIWLDELRRVTDDALAHSSSVTLDLERVWFVDLEGAALLCELAERSVAAVNASPFIKRQLQPPELAPRAVAVIKAKHPRAIRWFHWINFPLLALMIWSGLLIYWANDVYHIGPFHFFPNAFYDWFAIDHRLAEGMAWHFFLAALFAINGVAYVLSTLISGEWRYLVPNRRSLAEAIQVTLHDLHLRKDAPPPRKFNGAQQIAYTGVVLMGAGSLVTGLAIWKSVQFGWLTTLLGGYEAARLEHFSLTLGYLAFFLIHITQVIRAGWNSFRAMVTGVEIATEEKKPDDDQAAAA